MNDQPQYSWNQPCCLDCWAKYNPGRQPVRLRAAIREICVYCNYETLDGIYIRIDPAHARFPTTLRSDQ